MALTGHSSFLLPYFLAGLLGAILAEFSSHVVSSVYGRKEREKRLPVLVLCVTLTEQGRAADTRPWMLL